jgi:glucokinase
VQPDGLLLAGDVGGTMTILGIYSKEAGPRRPLATRTYPSAKYPALDAIVKEFLAAVHLRVEHASFDVAGPIVGGRVRLTNLPWEPLEEPALAEALGLCRVRLLNDLEAIALAITELRPDGLRTLQRRRPAPSGTIAVVAPGTGLGEAFLTWTGDRYLPRPSEGGHGDFAPGDGREAALLGACATGTGTSVGSWSARAWASPTSTTSWPTPGSRSRPCRLLSGSPPRRTAPRRLSRRA